MVALGMDSHYYRPCYAEYAGQRDHMIETLKMPVSVASSGSAYYVMTDISTWHP